MVELVDTLVLGTSDGGISQFQTKKISMSKIHQETTYLFAMTFSRSFNGISAMDLYIHNIKSFRIVGDNTTISRS